VVKTSYARHRFPPDVIQYAVRLYFRFPLSYRDVEELLAERRIDVLYETVRRWALKFGHPAPVLLFCGLVIYHLYESDSRGFNFAQ
jgi:transposase-like protein